MSVTFVDPHDRVTPLERVGDRLVSATGHAYPIHDDVPDFTAVADAGQRQTADSFGYKWTTQPDWGFQPEHQGVMDAAWRELFGWTDRRQLEELFAGQVVLDAGCGSGASLFRFVDMPKAVAAVDISAAVYACRRRFADRRHITFARADVMRLPFRSDAFDVIWSAGVLHHTPDTFASLAQLVTHLKPGGRIILYVYLKKAPLREFADDHVRQQIAALPPEEAWRRMEALTRFGRNLAALDVQFDIEEDVPELGFKAGRYDLQRFIYYHVLKCYWNDALPFDDNVHVNFDWYHPLYAHRHTPEDVRGWLDRLGLASEQFHVSAAGIAVVARRERSPRSSGA